jgi:hypothetical protein
MFTCRDSGCNAPAFAPSHTAPVPSHATSHGGGGGTSETDEGGCASCEPVTP